MTANRMARLLVPLVPALVVALGPSPAAHAATVFVNCASQSLQAKIDAVPPGTVILVKGTCAGDFVAPKNLTLKGNPTAILDGAGAGTTLTVTGTRVIHLRSLIVKGGLAENGGGISMEDGGVLTLDNVTVRNNVAHGDTNGFSVGGGIYANDATIAIRDSEVVANRAAGTKDSVAAGHGGGLYLQEGTLTVADSVFQGNVARADAALGVTDVAGGAAFLYNVSVVIDASRFQGNRAISVSDNSGTSQGGAIFHQTSPAGEFSITGSTFAGNVVKATVTGAHGATALAGAAKISSSSDPVDATVKDSVFRNNKVTASSAGSATAFGGAVNATGDNLTAHFVRVGVVGSTVAATGATSATGSGGGISFQQGIMNFARSQVSTNTVAVHSGSNIAAGTGGGIDANGSVDITIANSTLDGNVVDGQSDASVANAQGGGYEGRGNASLTLRTSTVSNNQVTATASGGSPTALGGGLDLESASQTDHVANSTITKNGASASGPNAISAGGAAEVANTGLLVRLATIARNGVAATGSNTFAGGGGLYVDQGTTFLRGTILAVNTAATGPNCVGAFTSEGFNLYGDTTGCSVTPDGTDRAGATPKLGQLADNGGPTMTLKPLAGSPALNKIPVATCHAMSKVDQRGVHRPQGPTCDKGAVERKP
jgi:hypothetical protein